MSNIIIVKSSASLKGKADFGAVIRQAEAHFRKGGKGAFFDCDRVLADADRANATSVLTVLKEFGLAPRPCSAREFIDICSGLGPRSVLLRLVPALEGEPALMGQMLARLAEIAAGNVCLIEKTPIVDYLPEIKARKAKIAILTNRCRGAIHPIIDQFGIRGTVDVVLHQSSILRPKPEVPMFQWSITLADVAKSEVMFWDDNPACVNGARLFGLPSRLVKWKADGASLGFEYLQG